MSTGETTSWDTHLHLELPYIIADIVADPPELFQLKCLSPALEARPHLNRNNTSVPQI
jgi:hypothetical protein